MRAANLVENFTKLGVSVQTMGWKSCQDPEKLYVEFSLRSLVRIEVRPTENDSTRLYKNGDILVVITCS